MSNQRAKKFSNLLVKGALKEDVPVLFTDSTEAIKLIGTKYNLIVTYTLNVIEDKFEYFIV